MELIKVITEAFGYDVIRLSSSHLGLPCCFEKVARSYENLLLKDSIRNCSLGKVLTYFL